ncbi:MAG: tetratricopeptide repeat protein [Bryobacteraceae bacterium]
MLVVTSVVVIAGALFSPAAVECSSALELARKAYESRQFTAAINGLEQAGSQCPDRQRILLPLAQAQLMAQRLEESLKTLDELLQLRSEEPDALKLRGDVLYLLAREEEAVQSLLQALKVEPGHRGSRYALGRIYYQQNRFPEAVQLFAELVQEDPTHYRAHDNLALSYAGMGRDSDALRHFLKALELVHKDHPEYDTVYANAANFFLGRGENAKGFQLAAEASKRNPESARNLYLTGKALAALEKHDLSLRWFQKAAELDASFSDASYWLAKAYRKLGRNEEAERELQRFRELSTRPKPRR